MERAGTSPIIVDRVVMKDGFVPVIDISAARGGDPGARRAVADVIGRACGESGFLVIVGHGVPEAAIADVHQASKAFFSQGEKAKESLRHEPGDLFTRGYASAGSLAASNEDADVPDERNLPDLMERFIFNPMSEPGGEQRFGWVYGNEQWDENLWMPNKWPDLPGFKTAFLAYFDLLSELGDDLMRLFALALGLPEEWFDDKIDQGAAQLVVNHYPAQTTPPLPGQLRLGKHSDWGSLTILFQDDTASGLQVLDKGGEWVEVPVVPGSYVVNIGDLMAIWTNDAWVSTVHRVRNPPAHLAATERYSIPFFHQPNHDALVACIPTCASPENPPKHAPVVAGHYLIEKYARAYG